jgi:hypothetical protein
VRGNVSLEIRLQEADEASSTRHNFFRNCIDCAVNDNEDYNDDDGGDDDDRYAHCPHDNNDGNNQTVSPVVSIFAQFTVQKYW